jgi:hypothetical protein
VDDRVTSAQAVTPRRTRQNPDSIAMIRVGPRPTARTIWTGHSVVNRCISMRVVQRSRCAEADAG